MLNNDATIARNALADEGKDGRIVSEIWIAMAAELAEHSPLTDRPRQPSRRPEAALTAAVTGGRHGSQTINLSEGTTFAYKMHTVKDWSKGKKKIEDMEADYKGMG